VNACLLGTKSAKKSQQQQQQQAPLPKQKE